MGRLFWDQSKGLCFGDATFMFLTYANIKSIKYKNTAACGHHTVSQKIVAVVAFINKMGKLKHSKLSYQPKIYFIGRPNTKIGVT